MTRLLAIRRVLPGHRLARCLVVLLICTATTVLPACDDEKKSRDETRGVTLARDHLYPYVFDEKRTLKGTAILRDYLADNPDGGEARMAHWLLGRTWLDMLTRVVSLQATDQEKSAEELLQLLATETGAKPEIPAVAKAIREHLVAVRDGNANDAIGKEADAGVRLLDGMGSSDQGAAAAYVDVGQTDLGMGVNARLLMAASALRTIRTLDGNTALQVAQHIADNYPFPCPEGFAAFAAGDRSLDACGFVCPRAKKAGRTDKQGLIDLCGAEHYGFVDADDAIYLTPENYVIVQSMRHMGGLMPRLQTDGEQTAIGRLHSDFISAVNTALAGLTLPSALPLMEADGVVQVPELVVSQEPVYGVRHSIAITDRGVHVNLPSHFRVERGQVYLPEVILRYRFPGRLAVDTPESFSLEGTVIKDGKLLRLLPFLDDIERDRPRVSERLGDLVPGAVEREEEIESSASWHRARLIVDPRTPIDVLEAVLYTALTEGYHPYDLVVWNPEAGMPGGVRFDAMTAPVPRAGWRVEIDGRKWTVKKDGAIVARAPDEPNWPNGLVSLYDAIEEPRGSNREILVTTTSSVSIVDLATVLEVLGLPAEEGATRDHADLAELIAAHEEPRAPAPTRVVLVLDKPADRKR